MNSDWADQKAAKILGQSDVPLVAWLARDIATALRDAARVPEGWKQALEFYADPKSYDGTKNLIDGGWGGSSLESHSDVITDRGLRARVALDVKRENRLDTAQPTPARGEALDELTAETERLGLYDHQKPARGRGSDGKV